MQNLQCIGQHLPRLNIYPAQDVSNTRGENPGLRLYVTLSIVFFEEWRTIIIYTLVLFVGFCSEHALVSKTLP